VEKDLFKLIISATEIGYTKCAIDLCVIKEEITMRQAYKAYGRKNVDRWISEGKVVPVKRNGRLYIKRIQIDTVKAVTEFKEN